MNPDAVFHEGERLVQERAGERTSATSNGRVIGPDIPERALAFVRQQGMVVLTTVDPGGRPWSSLLFGEPGFMWADSPQEVVVDVSRARGHPADPLWGNLEADPMLGLLLIELSTRRRLRINGRAAADRDQLRVQVLEAYPNCPKYVQRRHSRQVGISRDRADSEPIRDDRLRDEHVALLDRADTLFVASLHPERGADASHRGGRPGFARVLDPTHLRIPDYRGNSMFNTLGNFAVHPLGGILVPDFERRRTVQVVGKVKTLWDLDDPAGLTGGTSRFWDLSIEDVLELPMGVDAPWEFLDASPFNP